MAKRMKEEDEYFGGRKVKRIGKTNQPMPGEGKRHMGKIKPEAKKGLRSCSQSKNGKGYKVGE